jgi:hypothetical protein
VSFFLLLANKKGARAHSEREPTFPDFAVSLNASQEHQNHALDLGISNSHFLEYTSPSNGSESASMNAVQDIGETENLETAK